MTHYTDEELALESQEIDLMIENWEATATHRGFKITDLRSHFYKITGKSDWKAPIKVNIAMENISIALAAIEYFTATQGIIKKLSDQDAYQIYSPGYRNGPAGDH